MKKLYNHQTMQNSIASSKKMKNDYCQYFVDTGERPQNFIRDIDPAERFKDYPKLNQLIKLKNDLIKRRSHPPMYIKQDIRTFDLTQLGIFDVILMDPPWPEYKTRAKNMPIFKQDEKMEAWSLNQIASIKLNKISGTPSFLFIWAGSEHLDDARTLMRLWGYKRCEDIVWLKSNKRRPGHQFNQNHYLQHVKEHCLVGVKGDVRRASDSYFIHANIDTDVIVADEFEPGSVRKPEEIYEIIERFCLGRRKIELFADNKSIRPGWISFGKDLSSTNFDKEIYERWLSGEISQDGFEGGSYIGTTPEIENLRPKSPKQSRDKKGQKQGKSGVGSMSGKGDGGRGGGSGVGDVLVGKSGKKGVSRLVGALMEPKSGATRPSFFSGSGSFPG